MYFKLLNNAFYKFYMAKFTYVIIKHYNFLIYASIINNFNYIITFTLHIAESI